jgi:hypothetical protein
MSDDFEVVSGGGNDQQRLQELAMQHIQITEEERQFTAARTEERKQDAELIQSQLDQENKDKSSKS